MIDFSFFQKCSDFLWDSTARYLPARKNTLLVSELSSNNNCTKYQGRFEGRSGSISFLLALPKHPAPSLPPLVVMLHGCKQSSDDFDFGTRISDIATARGFAVLLPEQSTRNNGSKCWNWFNKNDQQRGCGESACLSELIISIIETYNTDRNRTYISGMSAGGSMALLMSHIYPEIFAAVGSHSGVAYGAAKNGPDAMSTMRQVTPFTILAAERHSSEKALPVVVFQGTSDPVVNSENAELIISQHCCKKNDLTIIKSEQLANGRAINKTEYIDNNGASLAELWLIPDLGHRWSGGNPDGSYTDGRGPCATSEMLRFFSTHRRNNT